MSGTGGFARQVVEGGDSNKSSDSLGTTLIIVICIMLAIAAVVLIVVVALEPHRRAVREKCHQAVVGKMNVK
jgi:hypothetical protein